VLQKSGEREFQTLMISFDPTICGDLRAGASREWLETNGLGGYASSTLTGMNTRRYHGLLIAARRPPTERVLLLSKLEESLTIDGERFDLSTNQYPQAIHPEGYRWLHGFRLDPFPIFTFRLGDVELEKTVLMLRGENTIVARYLLRAPVSLRASLELRPLIAFRDHHSLLRENASFSPSLDIKPGLINISLKEDELSLLLAHDALRVHAENVWYRNFEYAEERARGFDFNEDLFNPCSLSFDLRGGETRNLIASTQHHEAHEAAEIEEHERARRRATTQAHAGDDYRRALLSAAEQFIVRRGSYRSSVIAGYHWFTDWGRDTMISLPGLALTTGKFDTARQILSAFAEHLSEGMIPNRFPDEGDRPEYNTVDATLWFVQAIGEFLSRTGDLAFVRDKLYSQLIEIVDWHERGTRYGIKVMEDGLLRSGAEGAQLTWMDAKVGDWVVTPRSGKAVEIQALWHNALCHLEQIAARLSDHSTAAYCRQLAARASRSFNEKFWNDSAACLIDVLRDDGTTDEAIRPNQIFAVSLPFSMLSPERARSVVGVVGRELLTPYGLRSLAPTHPDYRGRYEGDALSRDGAYHQGTVWAWLMGPFITAYLKAHGRTPESAAQAGEWLSGFHQHLSEAGLGQISEIFDGDAPHTPRGCIAQAWSVAELLRCELEEL
jgi:predicted glycogen debranching enzyme